MTTRMRDVFHFEEDREGLKQLKKNIDSLNKNHIEWGILNKEKYPEDDPKERSGVYVAEIVKETEFGFSFINEEGHMATSPPRPFFSQSIYGKANKIAKIGSDHVFKVLGSLDNRELQMSLQETADALADSVRKEIDGQNFPPDHVKTLKRKESIKTLRDTDIMYESFTGKVVRGKVPLGDS